MTKLILKLSMALAMLWAPWAGATILFQPDLCAVEEAANWQLTPTAPNGQVTTTCNLAVNVSSLDAAPPGSDLNWQGATRTLPAGITGLSIDHMLSQTTAGIWARVDGMANAARLIYLSGAFGYWSGTGYEFADLPDGCAPGGWCTLGMGINGGVLEYFANGISLGQVEGIGGNFFTDIIAMVYNPYGAPNIGNRSSLALAADSSVTLEFNRVIGAGQGNNVVEPGSTTLMMTALALLFFFQRRRSTASKAR